MVDCPRCRLTNPDGATVCDCGYNFDKKTVTDPDRRASRYSAAGAGNQAEEQGSGMPGWVWFVLIYVVGNGILYQTTGILLIPIPRK
jgi:hypothetical protein